MGEFCLRKSLIVITLVYRKDNILESSFLSVNQPVEDKNMI